MPQLSIYIDEKTLRQLQIAAKIEKLSISKYVTQKLNESIHAKWPEGFGDLYGSIKDDSFTIDKMDGFKFDARRETL